MLYLPKGVQNFIDEIAIRRNMKTGTLLITIVCEWAWKKGFKCKHPEYFIVFDKEASKRLNNKMHKCKICGKLFTKDAFGAKTEWGYIGGKNK